ncbi:MAG: tyrosine-type recombinase/integrase [Mariniphaga sp.]|nr:tyrosine-type recombinase/integrase [Mariniphaga sp.]MDD4226470.1 tyrosine-type recombinase/integrase [Mariniphaga sp.]MDD4425354.1 tyrosine-type recombinase/integrase [Mariniphaga sp.]
MDYQESFISYLRYERRNSSHTVIAYKKDLDQFVTFCTEMAGEFDIKGVDGKLVRSWIVSLMEGGYTPQSVNRKVSTIKAFFRFIMKYYADEGVESNPAVNIPLPRIRKRLPGFVEENSLHHLFDDGFFSDDFEGKRDKLILNLLYGTGIRLAELLNLKDKDFNTAEFLIKVLGKRNKERIIPYPRSIHPVLEQYLEVRDREIVPMEESKGVLLVTGKGVPVYEKLIYRVVRLYLGKVTMLEKKSPHILRHTYATHLLNKGADLNAVKELLGHANLSATQIYTHTTFEKLHHIYKQAHPRG